mmetsp:Transcript_40896/g.127607  ORF Transcript_40896/g.127607 Transcript_40896/m.127607 type:complete len:437 (+) Transcript_40896:67-1377(+)
MGTPRGLAWVLAANLALAVEYSMLMPTGWQYIAQMGGSEFFYGATIAAYPIGRIVFMVPFGAWSDRRGFFNPFRAANAIGLCGGLVYGLASALGSKWYAMLGRFLGGCGATLPLSAWAARSYPPQKRVQIEAMQKAAQLIGVALGPVLNAVFLHVDVSAGPLRLNSLTCAGYFPAFMSCVLLVGFMYGVEEPPAEEAPPVPVRRSEPLRRLASTGAWACIVNAFHTNVQISAIDTIIAPLTAKHFGWTVLQNSMLFAALAVISVAGAVAGVVATKRGLKARRLIEGGLLLNFAGLAALCVSLRGAPEDLDMRALMAAGTVSIWATLIYTGANGGLYQQACGNSQGLLGALYTMAFAGGRPVGSLLAGALLGGSPLPMCCSLPACVGVAIAAQFSLGRRLQHTEDEAILAHSLREQGGAARLASVAECEGEAVQGAA